MSQVVTWKLKSPKPRLFLGDQERVPEIRPGGTEDLPPLVVDLDGTLTLTDTLIESTVQAVKRDPRNVLRLPIWLIQGRSTLKARIASQIRFTADTIPYQETLCHFLRDERTKGRRIVLATAANRIIADAVAAHLGFFDEVLASDETCNLKGETKLRAIRQRVGTHFIYVGDSTADLPIWKEAHAAVLVGASSRVSKSVRHSTLVEREFPRSTGGLSAWLRLFRVHQWLKNLLIFVPLLTAFAFTDFENLAAAAIAFLAFSFAASATYVVNDLLDLDSDRRHPRKRHRPLAGAQIPIPRALAASTGLLAMAAGLASTLSTNFLLLLIAYLFLTGSYSWVIKQYVLLDVLMLSVLYTLRIVAGAAAVEVTTSVWLLAFSVFIFLSLALVKRCSELLSLSRIGRTGTNGRDYRVGDLVVFWPMGVGAGLCAVLVFALFVCSIETETRYATPELLWLVAVGLIYWLGRLWIKTARGEMLDDPLVYALRDFGSRVTVAAMVTATLAAHFISLG